MIRSNDKKTFIQLRQVSQNNLKALIWIFRSGK